MPLPPTRLLLLLALLGVALSQTFCRKATTAATAAARQDTAVVPEPAARLAVIIVPGPPTGADVKISQLRRDESGPTSMRYYAPRTGAPKKIDDWVYKKGAGNGGVEARYYYRDRDLGQTFTTGPRGFRLEAITVRLQPVDVKGADPGGARVSVQLMRVDGQPRINENGTLAYVDAAAVAKTSPNGVSVWTGGGDYQGPCTNPMWSTYASDWPIDLTEANNKYRWPVMHYSDDYTDGETYRHLALATGGTVPASLTTDDYLRWEITGGGDAWELAPNSTYAFVLLFDEPAAPGVNRNIPLSNINVLPGGELVDPFLGGHMIRRDGATTALDEVFIRDVTDAEDVELARRSSAFPVDVAGRPDLQARLAIPPGTLGYPDVDTYRELWFVLEGK